MDEEELPAVKQRLAECVAEFDAHPRFTTVVAWLVDATEELRHPRRLRGKGTDPLV